MFTFWTHLDKKVLVWMSTLWFFSVGTATALAVLTVPLLVRTTEKLQMTNPGWLNLLRDLSTVVTNNWLIVVPVLVIVWGIISLIFGTVVAAQNSRISKWVLILFSISMSVAVWGAWWFGLIYLPFTALLR